MSEHLHPGLHPDADSMNAFLEGVLPEHEREAFLAHLAECAHCREVAFVAAGDPVVAATTERMAPTPVPWWRRWFVPAMGLSAAAAAAVLLVSVVVNRPAKQPDALQDQVIATARKPAEAPPVLQKELKVAPAQPRPMAGVRSAPRVESAPKESAPDVSAQPAPRVFEPDAAALSQQGGAQSPRAPAVPANSQAGRAAPGPGDASATGGIAGVVRDATGAGISGAGVTVRPLAGTPMSNGFTDRSGQFNFSDLGPGKYELQITKPGFQQGATQVDVRPREMAKADTVLSVGAVSEAVTVEAAAPSVSTQSATVSAMARARKKTQAEADAAADGGVLINNAPAAATAVKGKVRVATDSAGALYLSKNAGKSWKTVKGQWQGKVVRLATTTPSGDPSTTGAVFELTTDAGAVWVSRDGEHWLVGPAGR